ncbi:MAG: hypothetical protein IRY95_08990, partial [Clostridia bacterium]|nr:hypothetical protein [Clostridia bacterium]
TDVWEHPWQAFGTVALDGGDHARGLAHAPGGGPDNVPAEDRVLLAPGEAAWASWSPRGDTVLFGTPDGTVMAMNPDGTAKRLLFHLPHPSLSGTLFGRRSDLRPGPWSPRGDRLWLDIDADGGVWFLFRNG